MKVTSFVAVVAQSTGKIIKNCLNVFKKGENLLQNGIFNVFRVQPIVRNRVRKLEFYADEKLTFLKKGLALKWLISLEAPTETTICYVHRVVKNQKEIGRLLYSRAETGLYMTGKVRKG